MATHGFKPGDSVEVWSNSQKAWVLDGKILSVAETDCEREGYAIPRGALKVEFSGGSTKWILPDQVADSVRRASTSAVQFFSPPVRLPSASDAPHCKFGCGRCVQPGMTRGMKRYDTCCKKCALSAGAGEHDQNCEGAVFAPSAFAPSVPSVDPKKWLEEMLTSEDQLRTHTSKVVEKLVGKAGKLDMAQVKEAIATQLLEPIGVKLQVGDKDVQDCMAKYADKKKGTLDTAAFEKLAKEILESRSNAWFPTRLPAKACNFVRKNPKTVKEVYEFGKKLGEGSFGTVWQVTHRISKEVRVCKTIPKLKGRSGMKLEEIMQEIESMSKLDHPNVIKVYEFFEDADNVSQIMEPCYGGEVQDKIDAVFKKGAPAYKEEFVCDVMKQTLRALAFMHNERFLHKDLKPQNIMLCDTSSSNTSIKVIDFGLAELFNMDQTVSKEFGGTLLYMAPEVFKFELTVKVDVWSLGCILYNLLTGDYPFMAPWPLPAGRDMEWWQTELERMIRSENYRPHKSLQDSTWSAQVKDLLDQMLQKDVERRPDAAKCLDHPWFKSFEQAPAPLSPGLGQCLDAYSNQHELKKAVFMLIAHQWGATEDAQKDALRELREVFTHFDVNNRGSLSTVDLRQFLMKSRMTSLQVEKILYALDRDNSDTVEWTEFIAAALCVYVCGEKRLTAMAFSMFDRNGLGKISARDIEELFAHGDVAELWRRELPPETAKIAKGSTTFTSEQFEKYMGQRMRTVGGESLSTVAD